MTLDQSCEGKVVKSGRSWGHLRGSVSYMSASSAGHDQAPH